MCSIVTTSVGLESLYLSSKMSRMFDKNPTSSKCTTSNLTHEIYRRMPKILLVTTVGGSSKILLMTSVGGSTKILLMTSAGVSTKILLTRSAEGSTKILLLTADPTGQ